MADDIYVLLSTQQKVSKLYHEGKLIYQSDKYPIEIYFGSWASVGRAAILGGNRLFFATATGDVISLLMKKSAIDKGAKIEAKHHTMADLAHLWADSRHIVCLSRAGQLDIVKYTN